MEAGFSLGSNLGDRKANLADARERLADCLDARAIESAPIYETEPIGVPAAYRHLPFLNTVIVLQTDMDPWGCLHCCRKVESAASRVRIEPNSPRPIDADILYIDNVQIDSAELAIPHPRYRERRFVLQPLADLRSDLILPGDENSISKLLEDLGRDDRVELFLAEW